MRDLVDIWHPDSIRELRVASLRKVGHKVRIPKIPANTCSTIFNYIVKFLIAVLNFNTGLDFTRNVTIFSKQ